MWFPSAQAADGWRSLGPQHQSKRVLYDDQWILVCPSASDCQSIQQSIGGTLRLS